MLPYNYPQEIVLGYSISISGYIDICQWCEYLILI